MSLYLIVNKSLGRNVSKTYRKRDGREDEAGQNGLTPVVSVRGYFACPAFFEVDLPIRLVLQDKAPSVAALTFVHNLSRHLYIQTDGNLVTERFHVCT